jgi:hypothetical protein
MIEAAAAACGLFQAGTLSGIRQPLRLLQKKPQTHLQCLQILAAKARDQAVLLLLPVLPLSVDVSEAQGRELKRWSPTECRRERYFPALIG